MHSKCAASIFFICRTWTLNKKSREFIQWERLVSQQHGVLSSTGPNVWYHGTVEDKTEMFCLTVAALILKLEASAMNITREMWTPWLKGLFSFILSNTMMILVQNHDDSLSFGNRSIWFYFCWEKKLRITSLNFVFYSFLCWNKSVPFTWNTNTFTGNPVLLESLKHCLCHDVSN